MEEAIPEQLNINNMAGSVGALGEKASAEAGRVALRKNQIKRNGEVNHLPPIEPTSDGLSNTVVSAPSKKNPHAIHFPTPSLEQNSSKRVCVEEDRVLDIAHRAREDDALYRALLVNIVKDQYANEHRVKIRKLNEDSESTVPSMILFVAFLIN